MSTGHASPYTAAAGIAWPAVAAGAAAQLLALQQQLEQSQWWPRERLERRQHRQLSRLLDHAYATVPFYRRRLDAAGFRPGHAMTPDLLRKLPLVTRRDIQDLGRELLSTAIPGEHGRTDAIATSGSTGIPVTVVKTELEQVFWDAITLRNMLWHGRDMRLKLAAIRNADLSGRSDYPRGNPQTNWGRPFAGALQTGLGTSLDIRTPIADQVEWLAREEADYVLSHGTNLLLLARHCRDHDIRLPRLKGAIASATIVEPELRELCRDVWGARLSDMYSTVEVGYVALQCPHVEHYHVQMESAIVEVLDPRGKPCAPGEIGEVVVTPLHNYAMPLIRYALADYAEVGEPCPCGRGLDVLRRIVGRERDMLVLPSGERRWGFHRSNLIANIPAIVQYQIAQVSRTELEIRVVVRRPLEPEEEADVIARVAGNYRGEFHYRIVYRDEIPRAAGGKYFVFRSELPP